MIGYQSPTGSAAISNNSYVHAVLLMSVLLDERKPQKKYIDMNLR